MVSDELNTVAGERPSGSRSAYEPTTHLALRRYALIAFDWDGTAVNDRRDDAGTIAALLDRLLAGGVPIMLVTGTNYQNIDRQLVPSRLAHRKDLFIGTNRGSEIYGFDDALWPRQLWKRVASPFEERLLDEIAAAVQAELQRRTGLPIAVVADRLNRRKIDLIPIPKWRDPPKSALPELVRVVEERLRAGGLQRGIADAYAIAERIARTQGLTGARITSDGKHLEIGLTDKADAIKWMMRNVAGPRHITPSNILIAGDEFGPIGGVLGSDSRMMIEEASGATFVSVGPEPFGVTSGVEWLGGGPARFRELVAEQVTLVESSACLGGELQPGIDLPFHRTRDAEWVLIEEGFQLAREHEIESLFAVANGYVGTRGSLAEGSPLSSPATFIAGLYDLPSEGGVPELWKAPSWLPLGILLDGRPLRLDVGEQLEHRRILDMKQGILWREWRHLDETGRLTRILGLRCASLADRHLLIQSVLMTAENYSATALLEVRIRQPPSHFSPLPAAADDPSRTSLAVEESETPGATDRVEAAIALRVPGTEDIAAFAAFGDVREASGHVYTPRSEFVSEGELGARWNLDVELGHRYRLDRVVAVHTSREGAGPLERAVEHLDRRVADGVDALLAEHVAAWRARWLDAAVDVEGDEDAARALHFAAYHLIAAANPGDDRVSIGARALTGAAYKGHVFWDTDLYMMPFFIYTQPEAARALLGYRYRTLEAARDKAQSLGYGGALYPWESALDGRETTPPHLVSPTGEVLRIYSGEQQHHIVADVAWAVWQYFDATADEDYLASEGAEILVETARFWASRGRLEDDGQFHIRHVMGPDEYHINVDDNAYTNVMAQWNLRTARAAVLLLEERQPARSAELRARLDLSAEEVASWQRIATAMYTGFEPRTGRIEQFAGYDRLDEPRLGGVDFRRAAMDLIFGRERTRRTKLIKQADVVLLLHLFPDRWPRELRAINFRYYEPRTNHGSSLSPAIHAAVAARLGDAVTAERYFRQAAEIDLANNMGNAAGGVHAAALGGLWQAAIFGFGGMSAANDVLTFDPLLPRRWRKLSFAVRRRGQRIRIEVSANEASATHEGTAPLKVRFGEGAPSLLEPGEKLQVRRAHGRWKLDAEGAA